MALSIVEGWTDRISYQLYADGAAPNLTGMSAVLLLYTNSKGAFPYSGTSGILSASSGTVYFDPAISDLLANNSPYFVRWRVTDGSGKVSYFPNSEAEEWTVRKP